MTPAIETTRPEAQPTHASLLDRIVEQQAAVASRYKPVMSTEEMVERERAIQYLVDNIMREGVDYGWIPGTKPKEDAKPGEYQAKPTLFKAGAERACAFFGYVPEFGAETIIEEWTAEKFGEMLFYYSYRCTLLKDKHAVGSGLGSASTWESKYRYRNAERTCPGCGKPNIRKSKPKPGQRGEPGFYCWEKTGGCGATFEAGDPAIVQQEVGKMPNPDIADVVNTVQKMGQKRAYVAATLTATGLSGRFTQDMEDMPSPHQREEPKQAAEAVAERKIADMKAGASYEQATAAEQQRQTNGGSKPELSFSDRLKLFAEQRKRIGDAAYYAVLGANGFEHANAIKSLNEQRRIYRELSERADYAPEMGDAYEETEAQNA